MAKWTRLVLVGLVLVGCATPMVMAEDAPGGEGKAATKPATEKPTAEKPAAEPHKPFGLAHGLAIAGACFGAGLAAIGGGWAISRIGGQCIDSMARQPEASGAMFAPMIVTAAMVEGLVLFAIVVCLLGVLFI